MINSFKIALIQSSVNLDKIITLNNVVEKINEAAKNEAKICVLPECFNTFYVQSIMKQNAEKLSDSVSLQTIQKCAKENQVYIIGSIPENDNDQYFNTALLINKNGELQDTYRKSHLFDIDIKGKMTYKESDLFTQGNQLKVFKTEYGNLGIGICYDLRFSEFAQSLRLMGADMILYPGAFNLVTGPMHWELLLRARAVDQQCFVCGVSSATYQGEDKTLYKAYGHTMMVDPKGVIMTQAKHEETILYADIDLAITQEVRQSIPTSVQKRNDIYVFKAEV